MKAFSQHSLSRRTLLGAGIAAGALSACPAFADLRIEITGVGAVSYTHLTLPTIA